MKQAVLAIWILRIHRVGKNSFSEMYCCPEVLALACWSKYDDYIARYHSFTSPISRDKKSNKNTSSSTEELKTL